MREQLIGYLLGALDDGEHAEVERQLAKDPHWREALDSVRQQLLCLEDVVEDVEPPRRLAERTCSVVAAQADSGLVSSASGRLAGGMQSGTLCRSPGKIGDMVVAGGVCLAIALLFFPAISNSRQLARTTHCHNNLRQVGLALSSYCDQASSGYFPWVPSTGNRSFAGIYGPVLVDSGYLTDPNVLLCPSSDLVASRSEFRVPRLGEVDAATGNELLRIRRMAGGSYGYNLGFLEHGRHRAVKNAGRTHFAIMADAPALLLTGYQSLNHGGRGQNLLYEDGHVRYVVECVGEDSLDHPFRNHFGIVEAGVNKNDAVIAPSFAPPFINLASQRGGHL